MIGLPIEEAIGKMITEVIPTTELPRVFDSGRVRIERGISSWKWFENCHFTLSTL